MQLTCPSTKHLSSCVMADLAFQYTHTSSQACFLFNHKVQTVKPNTTLYLITNSNLPFNFTSHSVMGVCSMLSQESSCWKHHFQMCDISNKSSPSGYSILAMAASRLQETRPICGWSLCPEVILSWQRVWSNQRQQPWLQAHTPTES